MHIVLKKCILPLTKAQKPMVSQKSMETASDNVLAERLRREDPEQFHTLVRMHLSFVLDLNTDDGDCASEKSKSLLQKWGFVPFSKKGKCVVKGVMEGAPLTQEGICQVYQLIEFLSKEQNICQEGIFRRSGKMTRQQELKSFLNQGVPLNLDDGNFSVHDCASVLKNFLAELPESLLTDAHYPAYCQIAEMCGGVSGSLDQPGNQNSEMRLLRALQLLFLLLPTENRVLLKDVLQLLHLTAKHEGKNKMSADSLATLFTPHLLCPRKLSPEAIHINSRTMSGVIAFMIQQGTTLFDIPPKLATDIRAYLAERERRKLSPKKELNESVYDGTAANTVFSFVDRERTALAHVTNPTEAALAQLYAHIQSLPESSKKKKLIKQFNKENGQGTPLQVNMRRKNHLRSKSLGDSIKKHIFHKGTKQKNGNNQSQLNGSHSVSQEVLNKPGTCLRLFQKSMDEDSRSYSDQDEVPGIHDSHLSNTNCVLLHLQYTTPDRNSGSDVSNNRNEIAARKEILQNLASQIAARHRKDETNELLSGSTSESRKRASAISSESLCENGVSPPKASCCAADPSLPSLSHNPTTPCHSVSRNEGADTQPETMMTPRSRKPVVLVSGSNLCHLANISVLGKCQKQTYPEGNGDSCKSSAEDENVNNKERCLLHSCTGSYSMENIAMETLDNNSKKCRARTEDGENEDLKSTYNHDMASDSGSLTSTFRSYLLSRSILTASPVDLSFSSRTGDFDTSEGSNDEKILERETLSNSLLYCLDGNHPSNSGVSDEEVNHVCGRCSSSSKDEGTPAQELLVTEMPRVHSGTSEICGVSQTYDEKISHVKPSRVALMSHSKRFCKHVVHETSL